MRRYFNLSESERAFCRTKYIFCLVIYDIVSNKRRVKLAQLLSGYGIRVQRSCFECDLTEKEYRGLLLDLADFYEATELDSILVYRCRQEDVQVFARYQPVEREEELIFL